jgi:endoglucanase
MFRGFKRLRLNLLVILVLVTLVLAGCGESPAATSNPTTPFNSSSPATTQVASSTSATSVAVATAPATTAPATTAPAIDTKAQKVEVQQLLGRLWQTYKQRYVQQDGRVKDPQRADASTSEGQSYALLRAFWQDDRTTFDSVLNWSLNNLQLARGDKLFAYLWGKNPDNSWKVIDRAAATDADQDIAFALILAGRKWNEPRYQTFAQQIMDDIWNKTVVQIKGQPYLTAGDWSPALAQPVLNPSYFSPYEYRLFAQVDPDKSHNWSALIDSSYEVIKGCTTNKLDAATGKLPPNWCAIDKQSGALVPAQTPGNNFDSDYGYDAFRTVWRLALDYRWYGEKRATDYLQTLDVLKDDWKTKQKLAVIYDHAGQPKDTTEDLGIYSGSGLALFLTIDPVQADQIVALKLLPALREVGKDDPDPAHIDSSKARTYYAQNWTWFGLALYADILPRPALS